MKNQQFLFIQRHPTDYEKTIYKLEEALQHTKQTEDPYPKYSKDLIQINKKIQKFNKNITKSPE